MFSFHAWRQNDTCLSQSWYKIINIKKFNWVIYFYKRDKCNSIKKKIIYMCLWSQCIHFLEQAYIVSLHSKLTNKKILKLTTYNVHLVMQFMYQIVQYCTLELWKMVISLISWNWFFTIFHGLDIDPPSNPCQFQEIVGITLRHS